MTAAGLQGAREPGAADGRWLQAVHIAGSVASITGLSLLTLNKALPSIALGEILGWLVAASLLLALLMLVVVGLRLAGSYFRKRFGRVGAAVLWLTGCPVALVFMIVAFQAARELVVPLVILMIYGQYPAPT